ncbi:MAG: redoxin [Desulfobulbus propionicus]|nr:MAG: redoxin [Desulfobulbus propionicus]
MKSRFFSVFLFVACLALAAPSTGLSAEVGRQLPSFQAKTMAGTTFDMDAIIGKKTVMLVFWASWCPSCKSEVPRINALVKKYKPQGMEFIGINIGSNDSPKRARAFMKKYKMAYPVIFDRSGTISQQYRVLGVPTIIVADKSGTIQFKNYGVPKITDNVFKILQSK